MIFNKQFFALFEEVAKARGLEESFINTLIGDIPQNHPITANDISFELNIKGLKYPLSFNSAAPGKIFEIKGTNTRYKTSSLIFIALLLGWEWEPQMKYINNTRLKPLIDEIQNQVLSNKTEIEFNLACSAFSLLITKDEEALRIYENNDLILENFLVKNSFDEYQSFVSHLFRIQFVSKGRDFVSQVHNEILLELSNSIEFLITKGQTQISLGMAERQQKVIYPKTLREYKNSLVVLNTLNVLIEEFTKHFPGVNNLEILNYYPDLASKNNEIVALDSQKKEYANQLEEYENKLAILESKVINPEFSNYVNNSWADPISNLETFNNTINSLEGNQLISFSVELPFNRKMSIGSKTDLENLFDSLDTIQKSAIQFYEQRENYLEYQNLKRLIDELKTLINSSNSRIDKLRLEIAELSVINRFDYNEIEKSTEKIKIMAQKVEINGLDNLEQCREKLAKTIKEHQSIITNLEKPSDESDYLPYEILSNIIFELRAVQSLLDEKGKSNINEPNLSIKVTAEQSQIYTSVIDLFNKLMKERCKYYYKIEQENAECVELDKYDFLTKTLTTKDGQEINALYGLSGGIDSAMTVRSLASCSTDAKYGTIVLVDEWGDVSDKLAEKVYDTLNNLEQLNFCVFVKVTEDKLAKVYTLG